MGRTGRGQVRDQLEAGILVLWCGTLGYDTEIFEPLAGLFVSLHGLHLHLVLLMLLLQLLVSSINRKERVNRVRPLAAATQQRNCAAPEGKV